MQLEWEHLGQPGGPLSPLDVVSIAGAFRDLGSLDRHRVGKGDAIWPATFKPIEVSQLLDDWEKDHAAGGGAPSTAVAWRRMVEDFVDLVGDDALVVSPRTMSNYADHLRLNRGLSAKTINGRYLAAIGAVYSHGVRKYVLTFIRFSTSRSAPMHHIGCVPKDSLRTRQGRYSRLLLGAETEPAVGFLGSQLTQAPGSESLCNSAARTTERIAGSFFFGSRPTQAP